MPPNYQNTKIYKIWSPNTEQVYIGATVQSLSMRMTEHRKPSSSTSSSKIIINLGDAKIELLEEFPCNNKMESDKKEGEYIRKLDCVNKQIIGRTMKEWREDNKDRLTICKKEDYEKNKSHALEQVKIYRENNAEKIKEYRDKNKLELAEKGKAYREANLEKVREQCRISKIKNKEKAEITAKAYREKNKLELAEKSKAYREKNKIELAEKSKAYREANIEMMRERDRVAQANRRAKVKLEKEQSLFNSFSL